MFWNSPATRQLWPFQQGARSGARASTAIAARRTTVQQLQASARTGVAARGGTVIESLDTVFNGLIVNIPDARAADLLQIPGAVRLHAVRRVRPVLNHALPLHKVPDAWNLLPLGQNGAGAGIKIGMIDTGVDVNNPAFSDPLPPVDGFPKVLYRERQPVHQREGDRRQELHARCCRMAATPTPTIAMVTAPAPRWRRPAERRARPTGRSRASRPRLTSAITRCSTPTAARRM